MIFKKLISGLAAIVLAFSPIKQAKARELNDADLMAINAGGTALVSMAIAAIQKKPVFPAFKKGLVGGAVSTVGMRLGTDVDHPYNVWAGKLVNDVGISVARNGTAGRDWLEVLETQQGPLMMFFDTKKKDVDFALLPVWIYEASYMASLGKIRFDKEKSISYNTPTFTTNRMIENDYEGQTTIYTILLRDSVDDEIKRHELMHIMQFRHWGGVFNELDGAFMHRFGSEGSIRENLKIEFAGDLTVSAFVGVMNQTLNYSQRPMEIEAYHYDDHKRNGPVTTGAAAIIGAVTLDSLLRSQEK